MEIIYLVNNVNITFFSVNKGQGDLRQHLLDLHRPILKLVPELPTIPLLHLGHVRTMFGQLHGLLRPV
jgi:hypothetical protein